MWTWGKQAKYLQRQQWFRRQQVLPFSLCNIPLLRFASYLLWFVWRVRCFSAYNAIIRKCCCIKCNYRSSNMRNTTGDSYFGEAGLHFTGASASRVRACHCRVNVASPFDCQLLTVSSFGSHWCHLSSYLFSSALFIYFPP